MQTILVAGGAGFIGSHICEFLLNKNYHVIAVDNCITGSEENIKHLMSNTLFSFINKDITDSEFISSCPPVDAIFHFASPASPNKYSNRSYIHLPIETLLVNALGTYNLLSIAKKNNARFVFASTSEIYGDPKESPQKETYYGNVNPVGVRSVYDESKRYGEAMTMAFNRTYNSDVRIARIFNTYGPRMQPDDGRVISNFIVQALAGKPLTVYGDGMQTRSFCYIDDMVKGLIKMLETDTLAGEIINIGNPTEKTIEEIAASIKGKINNNLEVRHEPLPEDDPKQRKPDLTKATNLLEWTPTISLEEGLEKTITYFKSL